MLLLSDVHRYQCSLVVCNLNVILCVALYVILSVDPAVVLAIWGFLAVVLAVSVVVIVAAILLII